MKNILKIGLCIIAAIWLLGKCSGCNDDYTYSEYPQESDYSWLYGSWQVAIDGETHTICFLSNGVCTEHFKGNYGTTNATGNYIVESSKNRIRINYGDGYPSYIGIDGNRLITDGKYYRKID